MRKTCCAGLSPCSQNFPTHNHSGPGTREAPKAHDAADKIVRAHVDEMDNVNGNVSH